MYTLNCNGRLVVIDAPVVMGIVNLTPDSFYAGSRMQTVDDALRQAEKMLQEGALFIDVGAQSTRPQSEVITASDEIKKLLPVIENLCKRFPEALISVDTYYAAVAKAAVKAGAVMVNDISGGTMDADMLATVGTLTVPYVCMHIKGTPQTMQQQAVYENVTREVLDFFIHQTEKCRLNNINDVIIDPGFGFGKTVQHNFQLLKNLPVFKMLNRLMLVGISRKATIYKTLGITAEDALNGSTVLHTIALLNGANILRVHDVKEAAEAIKLIKEYGIIHQ